MAGWGLRLYAQQCTTLYNIIVLHLSTNCLYYVLYLYESYYPLLFCFLFSGFVLGHTFLFFLSLCFWSLFYIFVASDLFDIFFLFFGLILLFSYDSGVIRWVRFLHGMHLKIKTCHCLLLFLIYSVTCVMYALSCVCLSREVCAFCSQSFIITYYHVNITFMYCYILLFHCQGPLCISVHLTLHR